MTSTRLRDDRALWTGFLYESWLDFPIMILSSVQDPLEPARS